MNNHLTIQEFSKITGIEASKLRYWDEIGLFVPLMRNPENNYRCYSLAQILALNFVTVLSDLEIPLKTIADLRHDRDPYKLLELLEKHEKQLDMEMRGLRLRYSIIHARRELINCGGMVDESKVSVRHRHDMPMILWPKNQYQEGDTFVEPLASNIHYAGEHFINLSFPVGGYYDSLESLQEKPDRPDHFISLDPVGKHSRKSGDYLVGYVRGYYGDMGDLADRMLAYAKENKLKTTGPAYVIYLYDEISTKDPSQYLAQCCVAVKR